MGSEAPDKHTLVAGQTRTRRIHVSCECGEAYAATVHAVLNAADEPELANAFARGTLNQVSCPHCAVVAELDLPLAYHDPGLHLFALVLPESMRHGELDARIELLEQLADEPGDLPAYVRQAEVVFGVAGLLNRRKRAAASGEVDVDEVSLRLALTEQRELALDQREEDLLAREEDLVGKQEDLLSRQAMLERGHEELAIARAEVERDRESLRALSLDLAGQRRMLAAERRRPPRLPAPSGAAAKAAAPAAEPPLDNPPADGRPAAEIDRWRAGDDAAACFVHEDTVFLCARPGAGLADYRDQPPRLRIQLHQSEGATVAALVALPGDPPGELVEQPTRWLLDPAQANDRALLERLGERFAAQLDLYDDESRLVASWPIEAPLEDNVAALLEAHRGAERRPDAVAALRGELATRSGEELLGRKQHSFSVDSFIDLPSPSAARLALGIVSYWSEPDNERYLLLIKSLPVPHWREIRVRVARRALDFGLHLGEPLTRLALELELAGTEADLLRQAVASFAEVSLGLKTNDLDPIQEWGNWKALLAECVAHGVQVEHEIENLASAAARRAQEWGAAMVDEGEPGGDLSTLGDERLIALLTDHGQRRDAAVELCERGSIAAAKPIFEALRAMTRAEVVRVLPAMVLLGGDVIPLLVQGLGHHKSFIRQGCALALGSIRSEAGAAALIEMLLSEPTRIWMEAARALGDIGPGAVKPLAAAVERADGEGRERLAWALAHLAIGGDGRAAVEPLSRGDTTPLTRVVRRALQLEMQVSRIDAEVRGQGPIREQTIVRAFSRRFYESLSGDVNELGEDDIVEQEELLGDADIIEAVEVEGAPAGASR